MYTHKIYIKNKNTYSRILAIVFKICISLETKEDNIMTNQCLMIRYLQDANWYWLSIKYRIFY